MGEKVNLFFWLFAVTMALILLMLFWRQQVDLRAGFSLSTTITQVQQKSYTLYRQYKLHQASKETDSWYHLEGESVNLRYKSSSVEEATLLLQQTESIYEELTKVMNYQPQNKPLVLIYKDRDSFNQVFGWNDEAALGVYYAGVVRLLSPQNWSSSSNGGASDNSVIIGPMAHELAHLILDYRTRGNVQRWFTEGVAQDMERAFTGYTLQDPAPGWSHRLYPWEEMDRLFDNLPDQKLAYRQSLLAFDTIEAEKAGAMAEIYHDLAKGHKIEEAIYRATGWTWSEFTGKVQEKAYSAESQTALFQ
ncbi:hypothetical protein F9B85_04360 [Heliorestis acidaminivorans]|uniref:Peptidase MA-like domain-containing protein n=1 Tax=Heliorestis acidaminivorans TaxID=553427 RepID=A0A6I0EUI3_9FIRM|nr:hypothetical protein [Heliorestis acidaminivorans]KAB2953854.1 hypothetical protein F9B85_04360 [Heliorestis acidaminivorans]